MSQDEPTAVQTSALPNWARVLIGLFVTGLVALIALIVVGSISFAKWQDSARDPEKVKQIAQEMMKIEALPPGFAYKLGYRMPGSCTVTIANEKDQSTYLFLRMDNVHKLVPENIPSILPRDPTQPGGELEVKSSGVEMVAGQKMDYIMGSMNFGTKLQQMRGAMLVDNNKSLLRMTGNTPGNTFNMDATRQLLASIKGF